MYGTQSSIRMMRSRATIPVVRPGILLTGSLIAVLAGLAAADILLVEGVPAVVRIPSSASSVSSASSESSVSSASSESSATTFQTSSIVPVDITPVPVPVNTSTPEGAVRKRESDIFSVIAALGFTAQETQEQGILPAVVREGQQVRKVVLLREDDRAGLLLWIETPDVKQVFLVLKETLRSLFSPEVRDLLDEVQVIPGRPPRNFLTFSDPKLSEERLVFVRVRERLFEFHIASAKEDAMYKLVEALTE